jgi:hypothetical protein
MTEAVGPTETSVTMYRTTRRDIARHSNVHTWPSSGGLQRCAAPWGTRTHVATLCLQSSPPVPIQSTSPYPICPRSILILSTHLRLGLPSGLFPSDFPTNNLYVLHAPPISSSSTWRGVQITKLPQSVFLPYCKKRLRDSSLFGGAAADPASMQNWKGYGRKWWWPEGKPLECCIRWVVRGHQPTTILVIVHEEN